MKVFRGYKELLQEISKQKTVLVKISIWTHQSPRMTFELSLRGNENIFTKDMDFESYHYRNTDLLVFKTTRGKRYKFHINKIRVAKVDYVSIK